MFCDADDALFHKILYNKAHLLHMYLPDRSQIVYTLRNRNHNKIVAIWTNDISWYEFCINIVIDYNLYSIVFTVTWSCVWQLFIKEFYDDDDDEQVAGISNKGDRNELEGMAHDLYDGDIDRMSEDVNRFTQLPMRSRVHEVPSVRYGNVDLGILPCD